jgi:hypothetical protein
MSSAEQQFWQWFEHGGPPPREAMAELLSEPSEYPDLEEYWLASFEHAESHYAAGSDSEWCEGDCAHWPSWWGDTEKAPGAR